MNLENLRIVKEGAAVQVKSQSKVSFVLNDETIKRVVAKKSLLPKGSEPPFNLDELRKIAKDMGLKVSGNKPVIVEAIRNEYYSTK